MGIRIDPLNLSESDYAGEWFNFTQCHSEWYHEGLEGVTIERF